jgi:hypothetical protein
MFAGAWRVFGISYPEEIGVSVAQYRHLPKRIGNGKIQELLTSFTAMTWLLETDA